MENGESEAGKTSQPVNDNVLEKPVLSGLPLSHPVSMLPVGLRKRRGMGIKRRKPDFIKLAREVKEYSDKTLKTLVGELREEVGCYIEDIDDLIKGIDFYHERFGVLAAAKEVREIISAFEEMIPELHRYEVMDTAVLEKIKRELSDWVGDDSEPDASGNLPPAPV